MTLCTGGAFYEDTSLVVSNKKARYHNGMNSMVPFYQADQLDPGIKAQLQDALTKSVLHLQPQYLVLDGRDKPSRPIQNIMAVEAKLYSQEHFIVEP